MKITYFISMYLLFEKQELFLQLYLLKNILQNLIVLLSFIFLSWTFIFFDFAISITVLLVIPSKNDYLVLAYARSPFLSLKKYLLQLLLQYFLHGQALMNLHYSLVFLLHVLKECKSYIILLALVSQGIVLGAGLLHLEIFNLIPSVFNFGSKYVPHSQVAIATCIFVFWAETRHHFTSSPNKWSYISILNICNWNNFFNSIINFILQNKEF